MTRMRTWPAWPRLALFAVAMLVVGLGSGIIAIWMVLAPVVSTGAADEQMHQPFPSPALTSPDKRGPEPAAVFIGQPYVAPPPIGEKGLTTRAVAVHRRVECRR